MLHHNLLFVCVAALGCSASAPPGPPSAPGTPTTASAPPLISVPAASGDAVLVPGRPAPTGAVCAAVQTPDQKPDEDTLRRIEHDWLTAEMRGNAQYLECLLLPDYVNIRKDGLKRSGSELIARVRKNAGKQLRIPDIVSTVVLHGNVATTYSATRLQSEDGSTADAHFIDSFVFVEGTWRAGVDL